MKQVAAPSGVFGLLLAVYLWTMAPGNFWIDSAAFTACNAILGLPHSPSFPLYTVLGRSVYSLLPTDPATASNLYSAFAAALGGMVLYLILNMLLIPLKTSSGIRSLAAAGGALFAFLAIPVWQSAVRAEVYSLQILLSLTVLFLFLKSSHTGHPPDKIRYALATVFIQGLSMTNHSLLALITLPLIIALPFFIGWQALRSCLLKLMATAVILFCIGISFYLYLPIRSNHDPAINSGQPKTVAAALQSISRTGEDYLPAGPAAKTDYFNRTGKLARFIFDQTGGLILLGLIAGFFIAIRQRQKALLMFTSLIPIGFAITIWAADFRMLNFDIVAYSALPLILAIMLAFYGLSYLAVRASERGRLGRLVPAIFVLMVFFQFSGNLYSSDLSGVGGPDRTAEIILEEAPSKAILLLNEDNVVLPLWYHCLALNKRLDIAVISAGALYRPTYRNELRVLYPNLKYPKEFESYKIENLGRNIVSFCEMNKDQRPIMVQFGVPGIVASDLIPQGFLFRYDPDRTTDETLIKYPSPPLLDYIADGATDLLTIDFVARTAFNYGVYFNKIGQAESAYRFFEYAISADGDNPEYLLQLGIAFLNSGRLDEAILLFEEAASTGDGCPEADVLIKQIKNRKYGQL